MRNNWQPWFSPRRVLVITQPSGHTTCLTWCRSQARINGEDFQDRLNKPLKQKLLLTNAWQVKMKRVLVFTLPPLLFHLYISNVSSSTKWDFQREKNTERHLRNMVPIPCSIIERSSAPSLLEQNQFEALCRSAVMSLFKNESITMILVHWWITFIRSMIDLTFQIGSVLTRMGQNSFPW